MTQIPKGLTSLQPRHSRASFCTSKKIDGSNVCLLHSLGERTGGHHDHPQGAQARSADLEVPGRERSAGMEHDHARQDTDPLAGLSHEKVAMLQKAGEAVGRIEVSYPNGEGFQLAGTAWLVRPTIAVTSRHVALHLRTGFSRSLGAFPPMRANIFGEEPRVEINFGPESIKVGAILWIECLNEDMLSPDLAFLQLEVPSEAQPLEIGTTEQNQQIAVIQYPVASPEGRLANPGFEHFALGQVVAFDGQDLTLDHTASTFGGSSGGPLVELAGGKVVGMHSGGNPDPTNRAVLASVIADRLELLASV